MLFPAAVLVLTVDLVLVLVLVLIVVLDLVLVLPPPLQNLVLLTPNGLCVCVCLLPVVDRQGCDPNTRFLVPAGTLQWVALLQRGNCTFREKILRAAAFNASAVLIYNNSSERTVRMGHEG